MRLVSLDVLRGLAVAGMILVNSAAALHYSAGAQVLPPLLHAPWIGLTVADWVFPAFIMMVGVSIPFALRDRFGNSGQIGRIGGRALRLVLLGLVLSNLYWLRDFSVGDWRLFGVLQRIGLVYGSCALLFLLAGPRVRLGLAAAILLLYWPLVLLPSLDGAPTDLAMPGLNFVASVDRSLFAPHIYVQGAAGFDPEGWLSTLPAIAHGLIGVALGELIAARGGRSAARPLLLAGIGMLVAGLGWSFFFPIVKALWTSSFVLVTCGITTILLAGLHAWLDRDRPFAPGERLFVAIGAGFGANAIAAYSLHMLTAEMPTWDFLLIPYHAMRETLGEALSSLLPIALYLLLIGLFVEGLRRRGWLIKI